MKKTLGSCQRKKYILLVCIASMSLFSIKTVQSYWFYRQLLLGDFFCLAADFLTALCGHDCFYFILLIVDLEERGLILKG